MGYGIERRARPRPAKGVRALFGRAPDARDLGARLARIARRVFKAAVTDESPRRVTLDLHPDASPVRISVLPDGSLEVRGETSAIGPGYHAEVLARFAPLLDELDLVWDDADDDPDVRAAMAAWLADELRGGATRVGMPAELRFKLDADVQTSMGPRDRTWRQAVIADPMRGLDAFAWSEPGPGQAARSRALLAMWLEVPWREPIDRGERALMERVDEDLRAARSAEPTLELPWAEWAELLDLLGADEARMTKLRARAAGKPPMIGYRRHPMEVELGAWTLELPGAFVGAWEDDRYWATDGDRMIELTTVTTTGEHDSRALLELAPSRHPVIATLDEPDREGRAEAYVDGAVHVVHGLVTASPEVAILTCKSEAADEAFALATWRSLRPRQP